MKLIFDLSSILWTCLLVGKDKEGKETEVDGRKVYVNSVMYGYENVVNLIVSVLKEQVCTPIDCIFAKEGLNSKSRRLMINRTYKIKRGKHSDLEYIHFQELRALVEKTFRSLGSIFVTQDNVEGDDLIAWLCESIKEDVVVVSNDNDLSVLDGTNKYGSDITVRINGQLSVNKYGDFNHKYITLYKAMVGDSSDSISGIPGFGVAAWEAFAAEFKEAGMAEMCRLAALNDLSELEPESHHPIVKRLWEGRDSFLNSWKLAKLHPEWVNTLEDQVVWLPGLVKGGVKDERLKHWSSDCRLVTGSNWEKAKAWMLPRIKQRNWLALDIETSTPPESDEWLEAQGDPDGVDVIGSTLNGMSLTFGSNMQYTVYMPVAHFETDNVYIGALQQLLEEVFSMGHEIVIQNTSFEGTVLYNTWGELWKDNGYHGLIPNWLDTKFEASYVDENSSLGLKEAV